MKRIIAVLLALISVFTFASCAGKKDKEVEKMLDVYNNTNFFLIEMVMAPSEDELGGENAVKLFDTQTPMNVRTGNAYTVKFPNELYKGNWVVRITGTNISTQATVTTTVELGELFNTSPDSYLSEVWGFRVDFDDAANSFSVDLLDGNDI